MTTTVKAAGGKGLAFEVEAALERLEFIDDVAVAAEHLACRFAGEAAIAGRKLASRDKVLQFVDIFFDDLAGRSDPPVEDEVAIGDRFGSNVDNGGGIEAMGDEAAVAALHPVNAIG